MFDLSILVTIGLIILGIGVFIFILGISFIDALVFGHDMPLAKISGMGLLFIGAIIALIGLEEYILAFIITVFLGIFIWITIYMMHGDKESYISFIGRQAVITEPATESKVGEIKVISPEGKTYTFLAQPEFHARKKPFNKGDHVYITGFNGIIAEYDTEPPTIRTTQVQQPLNKHDVIGQCVVCFLPIKDSEEYLKTPCCNSLAHTSHILEWVKIKGTCPNCQAPLSINEKELTVKS